MKIKSIYYNGGESLDCYTIVMDVRRKEARTGKYLYECIGTSESGLDIFCWSECMVGRHLGKKVQFEDLSLELQNKIMSAIS